MSCKDLCPGSDSEREEGENRGDEGGKMKDVPTVSSHRFRQLNRKS
jgi:hypothetical protein